MREGTRTDADPCRSVLVKTKVIRYTCKGTAVTIAPPPNGDLGIILSVGDQQGPIGR